MKGIICNLDIEKAYDHANWSFVLAILEKMRSSAKWLKWIEWCISIVLFFVLVNGTPLGFFQISRGLRQANPLSPYLFILAMKTLSCILFKAKEGRFIDGFLVKGRDNVGMKIFHLLFVDDTLILYNSCKKKLEHLNLVFMWFAAILRLKINLERSESVPVGEVPNMEEFAKVLSCKVGALPTTYLGLLLGALYKSSRV